MNLLNLKLGSVLGVLLWRLAGACFIGKYVPLVCWQKKRAAKLLFFWCCNLGFFAFNGDPDFFHMVFQIMNAGATFDKGFIQ